MDEKTRARLLRRADRLEHRLGVIVDEGTGELRRASVSEQQSRSVRLGGAAARWNDRAVPDDDDRPETASEAQARQILERYAAPSRTSAQDRDEYDDDDDPPRRESVTARQARQIRGE